MNKNVLYLHSKCHMKSPTWTKIDGDSNQAIVECAECGAEIIRLSLYEEKDSPLTRS